MVRAAAAATPPQEVVVLNISITIAAALQDVPALLSMHASMYKLLARGLVHISIPIASNTQGPSLAHLLLLHHA